MADRDLAARPRRRTSRPRQRPRYQSANRRPANKHANHFAQTRAGVHLAVRNALESDRVPAARERTALVLDARATGRVSGSTVRPCDFCSDPVVIGGDSDGLVAARATKRNCRAGGENSPKDQWRRRRELIRMLAEPESAGRRFVGADGLRLR